MASLQKAAYLGLKAGNPRVIACLNVLAEHRTAILQDLNANEAWPYFDTFNLHHYEGFSHYAKLYADFRSVSAGRPLWVTECSVPVRWQGDKRLQEPSAEDLQLQSERLTVTYAQALHEGAQAVFYFMLPHYVEGPTQFGILRPDLTPRPAFVALAAVGRLLADAKPLGRLPPASEAVHGYLFAAKPDGHRATVLVVWAEKEARLELSKPPMACFDHLGRAFEPSGTRLKLTPAPLFVVLTHGTQLPILPPPELPKTLPGKPCPLVLQAVMPEESTVLKQSAYKIPSNRASSIPIILYNFGPKTARGRLHTVVGLESSPSTMVGGWRTELPAEIAIGPGERQELSLRLTSADAAVASTATIRVLGDFGRADRPVLSFRIVPTVD
jgi:hypothetical protein